MLIKKKIVFFYTFTLGDYTQEVPEHLRPKLSKFFIIDNRFFSVSDYLNS